MRQLRVVVFTRNTACIGPWETEQSAQSTKERAERLATLCNENPVHSLGEKRWPLSTIVVPRQDGSWEIIPTREIERAVIEVKEIDTHDWKQ